MPGAENYSELRSCRIGGSAELVSVLDLGMQDLTGTFPKTATEPVGRGPLDLVWCPESGLVQLRHTYEPAAMYGENYGYRSGLNQSMVEHLTSKVAYLERLRPLSSGDVVLDIGSNDATTLKAYEAPGIKRIGIDPTGAKFKAFYTDGLRLVPDFFSSTAYRSMETQQARIITSIAMLYDLDSPVDFARQIAEVLAPDGIWHFEQSYLPAMLRATSYDTICHEHLEYYSLAVIEKILHRADLQLADVVTNSINGGSSRWPRRIAAIHRLYQTDR